MYNAEQIIIRDCEESDLPAILEIYNEAILNTTALFEYKIFTAERVGDWFKKKKEDNFPVFVAGVEDKRQDSVPMDISGTDRRINIRLKVPFTFIPITGVRE
jgi:hypothetical protein